MRLSDCFIDVLAYTKLFLRKPVHGYDEFRERVQRLVSGSKATAESNGFSEEEHKGALFPVVAFIDEAVMTSGWPEAENWKKSLLQKQYLGTTKAGVEFFERLDKLSAQNKTIREVYYFCLMLGFKGQYIYDHDAAGLQRMSQQTLELLVDGSETAGLDAQTVLFPSAYPEGHAHPRRRPSISKVMLLALVVPPSIIIVLYLIYQFLLSQLAANFSLFIK